MKKDYFSTPTFRLISLFKAFLLVISIHFVYAQAPTPCTTPPAGLTVGGDFSMVASAPISQNAAGDYYVCIPLGTSTTTIQATPKNSYSNSFLWNVTNATEFDKAFPPNSIIHEFKYNTEGVFWVAQKNFGANEVVCKKLTIFKNNPILNAEAKLCGSKTVTITIPGKSTVLTNNHSRYRITWGDGSTVVVNSNGASNTTATQNYSSTTDALNDVVIVGEYVDDANSVVCSSLAITLTPSAANEIALTELITNDDEQSYTLKFDGHISNVRYRVSAALDNGTYVWNQLSTDALNGSVVLNEPSINAINSNYCFKIAYVDNCGVAAESNILCSIKLKDNLLSSKEAKFDWNLPTQPTGILLNNELSEETIGLAFNIPSLGSPTATTFIEKTLDCNNTYNFWVTTNFSQQQPSGNFKNVKVVSNKAFINPASSATPPAPKNPMVVSYVNDASVNINIYTTVSYPTYKFYRNVNGSPTYTPIGDNTTNAFSDVNVKPSTEQYCYKFAYIDDCGRTSELSEAYCTIFLDSQNANKLNWTDYVVQNTTNIVPVVYYIEMFDSTLGIFKNVGVSSNLEHDVMALISGTGNAEVKFRIQAVQSAQLETGIIYPFSSYSNVYTFNLPASLFLPSAFTPNGDGHNDTFFAYQRFVNTGEMSIYDRWGNLIFETTNLGTGWDGTLGSKEAPTGTYTYRIVATNIQGGQVYKTGSVLLIR